MFKWFGQQPKKMKQNKKQRQKTRQLWEREFNIVKEGLAEEEVVAFVDNLIAQHEASQRDSAASLQSVIKTAVTDAEQIAASIKLKAQTEAEAEANRIISQAKQEARETAQEIERRAEIAAQKETEDILSVATKRAEITEVEAKQKALLFLLRAREEIEKEIREEYKEAYARLSSPLQNLMNEGQNIEAEFKSKRAQLWESKDFELKEHEATLKISAPTEAEIELDTASKEEKVGKPIKLQEKAPEEAIEQAIQPQEEVTASEPMEPPTEELLGQHPQEETDSARLKQDDQTLYTGEVELTIAAPVELELVSKLYNYLQTVPELRILYTRGSWDKGTTMTVVLEKSMPLISILSETPGVKVIPELLGQGGLETGKSSLPMRGEGKGIKRIKLDLKEA